MHSLSPSVVTVQYVVSNNTRQNICTKLFKWTGTSSQDTNVKGSPDQSGKEEKLDLNDHEDYYLIIEFKIIYISL